MEAAILAGMGVAKVPVYRQPRIVLLTTGDEVVEPGIPLPEGKIYNSNMTMLSARLRELGIESSIWKQSKMIRRLCLRN